MEQNVDLLRGDMSCYDRFMVTQEKIGSKTMTYARDSRWHQLRRNSCNIA
jgi:hypothetical protein